MHRSESESESEREDPLEAAGRQRESKSEQDRQTEREQARETERAREFIRRVTAPQTKQVQIVGLMVVVLDVEAVDVFRRLLCSMYL